ncbi:MAG: hypothetical protein K6E53_03845 [Lachnospiraceae bacterium]|nr:hypothetical protein [Lachnospiraceae bacterium]
MSKQTAVITEGPEKGIHVRPEIKENYDQRLLEIRSLSSLHGYRVFYITRELWVQLASPIPRLGQYSAWPPDLDSHTISDRIALYYNLYPECMPDIIYCIPEYNEFSQYFIDSYGYILSDETESGCTVLTKP